MYDEKEASYEEEAVHVYELLEILREHKADETLTRVLTEAAEAGFRRIFAEHPGERFYRFVFSFDENMSPYVSAFSFEALERYFAEEHITDKDERQYYRHDGCEELCFSGECGGWYAVDLYDCLPGQAGESCRALFDQRDQAMNAADADLERQIQNAEQREREGDPEAAEQSFYLTVQQLRLLTEEYSIRMSSATEAILQLREKGLFQTDAEECVIVIRALDPKNRRVMIPVGMEFDMLLKDLLNDEEEEV